MRKRVWLAIGAATLAGGVTACSLDDVMHVIPVFGTMIRQPAIKPYQMPRPMPAGTIPIDGSEAHWEWPTQDLSFVNRMQNPRQPTAESLARGQALYDIYCMVCHGSTGAGDGPVASVYPGVRNLTEPLSVNRTDGYLHSVIRYGFGLMPRYGDKIRTANDRWDVVNYMRQLQGGQ